MNPEISLWAGNSGFMGHRGFMPKRTTEITERLAQERLKQFEKSNLAIRKNNARRLDASRNALRVVERTIGGKLVNSPNLHVRAPIDIIK